MCYKIIFEDVKGNKFNLTYTKESEAKDKAKQVRDRNGQVHSIRYIGR